MDIGYNLDNLEASFKKYLVAGIEKTEDNVDKLSNDADKLEKKTLKKITIKNYLSDLRHFLGWLILYLKSHRPILISQSFQASLDDQIKMIKLIDAQIIEEYKAYLEENHLPIKTINRRLSTLRKFFSFCLSQGWLKENPAKQIRNLSKKTSDKKLSSEKEKILTQFKADLLKENISQEDVNSFLKDVEEFFTIV